MLVLLGTGDILVGYLETPIYVTIF